MYSVFNLQNDKSLIFKYGKCYTIVTFFRNPFDLNLNFMPKHLEIKYI
jgi:hypothetical protein